MTTDTKRKPEDKIAEPPKKWRNWYLAFETILLVRRGQRVHPGDVYGGTDVYASKDLAETAERAHRAWMLDRYGHDLCEYLGAEPEQ